MKIKLYETLRNIFVRNRETSSNSVDYETAKNILKNDKKAVLVDVRSPQEYNEKHLEASINIPVYNIEENCKDIMPDKQNIIIVYCQSGGRSKKAASILEKQGYNKVYNIDGGLDGI